MPAPHPGPARPSLADLAQLAGPHVLRPPAAATLTAWQGVTLTGAGLDSRTVGAGQLYAALPGAHTHGARFGADAAAAGAAAVLTDTAGEALLDEAGVGPQTLPRLVVADPRALLGRLAARIHGTDLARPTMIGITGTNGKTTTAHLVACALESMGVVTGLIGTVETRVAGQRVPSVRTTPEATDVHALLARMTAEGVQVCVMEVSSHALALHRVDGILYDVAVFTNLSQDHLDFHDDMESYFEAKASLFTPRRSRTAVICIDDAWGRRLRRRSQVPTLTVGRDTHADARIVDPGTDTFDLVIRGRRLHLAAALPGDFNVVNTALAVAALVQAGYDSERVADAVLADPSVPGRMEPVVAAGRERGTVTGLPQDGLLAVVDYAHTPDAVAAALAALRSATSGDLVVVVGAGGDRDRGKRAPMGAAAARAADVVIVTDDNPRSEDPALIRAAVARGAANADSSTIVLDVAGRRAAIVEAVRRARRTPGSTVAVVGKGHETGQQIGQVVHPFDDREVLAQVLAEVPPQDPSRRSGPDASRDPRRRHGAPT